MELINAIGRRKSAVARVYLSEGTGKITINKKELNEFFPSAILQYVVKQPLQLLGVEGQYDIKANLDGGGFTGQSRPCASPSPVRSSRSTPRTRSSSRTPDSSRATAVPSSARSRVSPRLVLTSSSASANRWREISLVSKPARPDVSAYRLLAG